MRLALLGTLLLLGCKDSTYVNPVESFALETVAGQNLPVNLTVGGYPVRIVSRQLILRNTGTGMWDDSTLSGETCQPASTVTMCNASGISTVGWSQVGNQVNVMATGPIGHVETYMVFVRQADGSLLRTETGVAEVYR